LPAQSENYATFLTFNRADDQVLLKNWRVKDAIGSGTIGKNSGQSPASYSITARHAN
jgi:hypothetical protein